jgi:3-hydroxyacyl-CoA dehydrogenase/enoyl-CoA hydratase/3-hydroxybutyryl-CoA epimerase
VKEDGVDAMRIERRADGIAVVILDAPDRPVNTLHPGLLSSFEELLLPLIDEVAVRGVVVASGKPDTFIAGADLKVLETIDTVEQASEFSRRGNALLQRVANCPKPVVAAVHGAALGGGLEVALACHYILASDDPVTVLAQPEVMLGLLPGGGGTQRLPLRIGLPAALDMMLTGRRVRARKARRMGLVDALTTPGGIADTAARAALALAEGRLARSYRLPLFARLAARLPLRAIILSQARKEVLRRTRGLYPAPLDILACVRTGLARGLEAGLVEESARFGKLVCSTESRRLVWSFNASGELKKAPRLAESREVKRLAVLGAGFMGAGIAAVSLDRSMVVVRDIDEDVLVRAARTVDEGLARRVRSGALWPLDGKRCWSRLLLTTDIAALRGADLVVEAVFEDLALKRRVLVEAEEVVATGTVIASNTSALPIHEIAAGAKHPERVLGMHYFSPVPKMPLLEIVAAPATAPWAVETARAVGIAQGKTVVVVRDGPGFFTTRILAPYLNEAMLLLEEGARIDELDRILKDFGYPVGPVALIDEVGLDVAAHVEQDLSGKLPDRGMKSSAALGTLVAAGYKGRKNRKGFYSYPAKGDKRPDREVYELLGAPPRQVVSPGEVQDRLTLMMINEAVHCLAESVIASPRDGDVAAVFGLGFPPFRGGPFHHVDAVGADRTADRLRRLAAAHGERFAPAPLLVEMARAGSRFYPG